MKLAIVNTMPIPSGEASVNRILSYAKGLVKLGNNVSILSSSIKDKDPFGVIDGVNYIKFRKKSTLKIVSLACALLSIIRYIKKESFDAIILVTSSAYLIFPMQIAAKWLQIPIIYEVNEFPFSIIKDGLMNKLKALIHTNISFRLFDGMIVMTKPLLKYYKTKAGKNCKMIEVPMTVDLDRFVAVDDSSSLGDYVAYCGNMTGNKDGVINLLKAFAMVNVKFPYLKLVLIGGTNTQKEFEYLKKIVSQDNIRNVVFYGKVDRDQIPSLLCGAKALALARPQSIQSEGGFPTKLGEYLATGKPVIVTAVGDIPLYLKKTNSYICPPDDINAFAEKIIDVFTDYPKALLIGKEGRKLAFSIFNSDYQSKRIERFIKSFIE